MCLLLVLSFTFLHTAHAGEHTPVSVSILRNAPTNAAIEDICCAKSNRWEQANVSDAIVIQAGAEPVWLRIEPVSKPGVIAFDAPLDGLELYRLDLNNHPVMVDQSGDMRPTSVRKIHASQLGLLVSEDDIGKMLFIRLIQKNRIALKLDFVTVDEFKAKSMQDDIIRGILFGAILMMISFNIIVSYIAREIAFLVNAICISGLLSLNIYVSGVGPAWIWTGWPTISNQVLSTSISVSIVTGAFFMILFLAPFGLRLTNVRIWAPPVVLLAILTGAAIILPAWHYVQFIIGLAAIVIMIMFVGLAYLGICGNIRARILFAPLALAIIPGLSSYSLQKLYGFEFGQFNQHILEITLCAEALFFSLALSYRIRLAERERVETATQLVYVQKSASRSMLEAVDGERRRIASDLHDTAGQGLMMVANQLSAVLKRHKLADKPRAAIGDASRFSRNVIDEIRRISHDLHPAAIDHLGWKNAVEELFENLSEVQGIKVDLEISVDENRLNKAQEMHVYRIIQELINNIARHSGASNCKAHIFSNDRILTMEISDDGSNGTQAQREEATPLAASLGHTIVDYRIGVLSGTWKMTNASPGTRIRVEIPVAPKSSNQ